MKKHQKWSPKWSPGLQNDPPGRQNGTQRSQPWPKRSQKGPQNLKKMDVQKKSRPGPFLYEVVYLDRPLFLRKSRFFGQFWGSFWVPFSIKNEDKN